MTSVQYYRTIIIIIALFYNIIIGGCWSDSLDLYTAKWRGDRRRRRSPLRRELAPSPRVKVILLF